jgi:hypothetical protein
MTAENGLKKLLDQFASKACSACIDEAELDRAIAFLQRKMKRGGPSVDAAPLINAAASMSLSTRHLTRARLKLGIVCVKAGNVWRWMWTIPEVKEDDSYVVWAQGWYSFEEVRNG